MAAPNDRASESLTRKAVVGTGWSSLSTVAKQLLQFASVALLARLLGPVSYGLMGMAALVTTFLVNFRDLGTAAAVVQRPSVSRRLLSTLFWVNLGFGLLLTLIVVSVSIPAAHFFREPALTPILQVLSVSFLFASAAAVHNALLSREMAFHKLAMVDVGSSLAGYLVALPCAFAGLGVWSLVFANLSTAVVGTTLSWSFSKWRPTRELDAGELRSVARFSLNLSGFGLVNYFSRNADNIIVGRFLGTQPIGYYQMAYNLMLYPIQNISSATAQVLLPAFSKIQDDNERFRSAYIRSCMLIGLITFPVMAGLGVVADPLVRALLGPKWIPVIVVFRILVPVGLVQSIQGSVGQIYVAKGRTDWMFRWGSCATIIFVASFLIGVQYGITGVATAYAIAYLGIVAPVGFIIAFRLIELRLHQFTRVFWPQLAITLGMALVCLVWLRGLDMAAINNPWIRLISTVLVGACVYILTILLIRPPVLSHLEGVLENSQAAVLRKILSLTRVFA